MNREAIEAQMDALMGEATPKKSPKTTAPVANTSKTMMAALVVGGAILGALFMGLVRPKAGAPGKPADVAVTVKDAGKESQMDLFFLGVGRYKK